MYCIVYPTYAKANEEGCFGAGGAVAAGRRVRLVENHVARGFSGSRASTTVPLCVPVLLPVAFEYVVAEAHALGVSRTEERCGRATCC